MKKIKNLLIDLDGTLLQVKEMRARTEFTIRSLLWWKPYSNPWRTIKALQKLVLAMKSKNSTNISNYARGIEAFAKEIRITEEEATTLLEKSLNDIFPKLDKYFSPVPGAKEFVNWASNHYKLFLATNPLWPPEIVEMRVKWAGLKIDLFESYTHAKRMKFCKSYIEFYYELIEQNQLNPKNCLMIGDTLYEDGLAKNIGIDVFILSNKKKLPPITLNEKTKIGAQIWTGNYSNIQSILKSEIKK